MAGRLSRVLMFWAACQSAVALFVNPPDSAAQISDPVYYIGQDLEIKWDTSFTTIDILLWQSVQNGNFTTILPLSSATSYSWTVSRHDLTAEGDEFFLGLYNHGDTSMAFGSHAFSILTSSAPATSSTSTFTTSSSTSSTSSATNSASTTAFPAPSSSSLSSGAIAGIAIGAVLGCIALAGLGWFLLRRRKQSAAPQYEPTANHEAPGEQYKYTGQPQTMTEYPGQKSPQHLSPGLYELGPSVGNEMATDQRSELDNGASNLVVPEQRSELYGNPGPQ